MAYVSTRTLMMRACEAGTVIPAFNIPYLPMVEPVVKALKDCNSVGLLVVARLEWEKFESRSLEAVRDEYEKFKLPAHTHLDYVDCFVREDRLFEPDAARHAFYREKHSLYQTVFPSLKSVLSSLTPF